MLEHAHKDFKTAIINMSKISRKHGHNNNTGTKQEIAKWKV